MAQGAKQMRVKKGAICAPLLIVPVGAVRVFLLLGCCFVLIFYSHARKRSTRGDGVRGARVKVHPVNRRPQDPETRLQFVHLSGGVFCTTFHLRSSRRRARGVAGCRFSEQAQGGTGGSRRPLRCCRFHLNEFTGATN